MEKIICNYVIKDTEQDSLVSSVPVHSGAKEMESSLSFLLGISPMFTAVNLHSWFLYHSLVCHRWKRMAEMHCAPITHNWQIALRDYCELWQFRAAPRAQARAQEKNQGDTTGSLTVSLLCSTQHNRSKAEDLVL